ncbi:hypothetical protein [Deinococcus koreensis]|uniref:hypothetical protein n=1 Tax=Deinococcus koreensis TaxID=2054903 RepID=UPI00105714FB|nr:hypothetical protein [Deinococcus koreensis]
MDEDDQQAGLFEHHRLVSVDRTGDRRPPPSPPSLEFLLGRIRPEQLHDETEWGEAQGLEEW